MKWIKASDSPLKLKRHLEKASIRYKGEPDTLICLEEDKVFHWCFWRKGHGSHEKVKDVEWPFIQWLDESVKDQMGYELSLMLYRAIKRLGKKELFEDDHKFIDLANQIISKYSNPLDALRSQSPSPLPDEQGDAIPADLEQRAHDILRKHGKVPNDTSKFNFRNHTLVTVKQALAAMKEYLAGAQQAGGVDAEHQAEWEFVKIIAENYAAAKQGDESCFAGTTKKEAVLEIYDDFIEIIKGLPLKRSGSADNYLKSIGALDVSIVDQLRGKNPYTTEDIDSEIGWDNCCDTLQSLLSAPQASSLEGETTCVFCEMPCEPAPTKRGWSSVRSGKGLHFDCAGKVCDQGNIIAMKELEEFGKDLTI